MRKLLTILAALTGIGLLAVIGCTDAGDPVYPAAAGFTVEVEVDDMVGWDNLYMRGTLTGGSNVDLTADGLGWSAEVEVGATGGYGYNLYTDDGTKAEVEVGGPYSVTVGEGGSVTGDTEVELDGNATDGFRIVVYNYNPVYDNIKFKGALWDIDWSTVERDGMSADGTVVFRNVPGGLAEGIYEWGAIHDDGTDLGFWLKPTQGNFAVTVGAGGALSGDLDFLIEAPEPETILTLNCDMTAASGFTTVHVRGSFNGWAMAPTDLADPDEDGIWTVELAVEQEAEIFFKFITDGSNYEEIEPDNCTIDEDIVDDGYTNYNRRVLMGIESQSYLAPWAACSASR
ncbi:MAG: hypothetical protein GY838_05955 [bacterium]|nr:hypothetical protein [bacterium]